MHQVQMPDGESRFSAWIDDVLQVGGGSSFQGYRAHTTILHMYTCTHTRACSDTVARISSRWKGSEHSVPTNQTLEVYRFQWHVEWVDAGPVCVCVCVCVCVIPACNMHIGDVLLVSSWEGEGLAASMFRQAQSSQQ